MRTVFRVALPVGFAFALLVAGTYAQGPAPSPAGRDFPVVGGDLANQRYSTLTRIDRSNIAKLGGAWMVHLEGGTPAGATAERARCRCRRDVHRVRLGQRVRHQRRHGRQHLEVHVDVRWADQPGRRRRRRERCLPVNQAPVSWPSTRRPARSCGRPSSPSAAGRPGPRCYYGGLVYAGISGGEQGVRGQIGAYDAKTGKEVWKFYTIPGPGEFGHDTWEGDSWTRGGGPLWTHPAIDPELGMVYVPMGNPYPVTNGSTRGGDNLFTASVLALDLKTGARKWHFQEVHHDIWDYDNPDAAGAGGHHVPRAAAQDSDPRREDGLHLHPRSHKRQAPRRDRGTPGAARSPKQDREAPSPIRSAIHPFPHVRSRAASRRVPSSACLFGAFFDLPVVMTPGTQGGLNSAPMAFSPTDQPRSTCRRRSSTPSSVRDSHGRQASRARARSRR